MAQPLTKRRSTGERELYVRRPDLEAELDRLLPLDWAILIERAMIDDHRSEGHLSNEALVHLVRKAHREGDERARDKLLRPLLKRCKVMLLRTLPDSRADNAEYLRGEALGRLGELFAEDGQGENPDLLDYYEVGLRGALATLRNDLIRTQSRESRRNVQLPDDIETDTEDPPGRDQVAARAEELTTMAPSQEGDLFAAHLVEALKELTPDERQAVLLRHMGYEEESKDPEKRTIATICGVTGRAVRYRLANAARKLSRLKEVQ